MKNIYRVISAAAVLLAAVACQTIDEEVTPENVFKDKEGLNCYFPSIKFDEPDTKGVTYGTNFVVTIDNGDKIGVWPYDNSEYEQYQSFKLTVDTENTAHATFEGGHFDLTSGEMYTSIYPRILIDTWPGVELSYTGQVQSSNGDASHLKNYLFAWASATCSGSTANFHYEYNSGFIQFVLTFPELSETTTFKKVILVSDSNVFTTNPTLNVQTGELSNGTMTNEISIDLNNIAVAAGGTLTVNMAAAPFSSTNVRVQAIDSDNKVYTCTTKSISNLEPGKAKRLTRSMTVVETVITIDSSTEAEKKLDIEGDVYVTIIKSTGATVPSMEIRATGENYPDNVYITVAEECTLEYMALTVNMPNSHVVISAVAEENIGSITTNTSVNTLVIGQEITIGNVTIAEDGGGLTIDGKITGTLTVPDKAAFDQTEPEKIWVRINETSTVNTISVGEVNCNLYVAGTVTNITTKATDNTVAGTVTTLTSTGENTNVSGSVTTLTSTGENTNVSGSVGTLNAQGTSTSVSGSVENLNATGKGTTVVVEKEGSVTSSITSSDNATVVIVNRTEDEVNAGEAGSITETQTKQTEGTITSVDGKTVAIIGTIEYTSISAAIEAANAMETAATITLIADCETGSAYTITTPLHISKEGTVLDLNGKTLTVTNNFSFGVTASDVTVKNGTLASGVNDAKATKVNSYILVIGAVNAGERIEGVTIKDVVSTGGGVSVGGSVEDAYIKGQSFSTTISNCTILSGDYYAICSQNLSVVTIDGGTYTANSKSNSSKVLHGKFVGADGPEGSIIVESGRFNGTIESNNYDSNNGRYVTLRGGTYNQQPNSNLIPEGYTSIDNENGTWTISRLGVAKVGETIYSTIAEAVAAANALETAGTITLLSDCRTASTYTISNPLHISKEGTVLDLNGKTLTVTNNFSFGVTASNVTVKDGTIASGVNDAKATKLNSYIVVVGAVGVNDGISDVTLSNVTTKGGISIGGSSDAFIKGKSLNTAITGCTVLSGDYYAVCSQNHSVVTIDGGTYTANSGSNTSGVLQGYFIGNDGPEGSIIVNSGTFNGNIAGSNSSYVAIKGGTFTVDPTVFCVPGYEATNNGDGTWTVGEIQPVAQIGETKYPTLAAAVAAAQDGDIIQLLSDIDFSKPAYANYKWAGSTYNPLEICVDNLTLDLNEHTISNMGNAAIVAGHILAVNGRISNFTIKNGTLQVGTTDNVKNSYVLGIAGVDGATIKNVTTDGGINVFTGSTDVVIEDCTINGTKYYTICAQTGSHVTIKGNNFTKNTDASVANPSMFWVDKAGKDSDCVTNENPEGNYEASSIVIEGGIYNVKTGGAFYLSSYLKPSVKGGTFNFDPTACVVDGYEAINNNDGTWTVAEAKVAQIGETKYTSLADAIDAVSNNGTATIKILKSFTVEGNAGVTIPAGKNITIDLNGKTITNLVTANSASRMIENKGTLTITDSSTGTPGTMTNEITDGIHTGQWTEYNYSTSIIYNTGTLTVEKGTLQQNATSNISYAIDNVGANTSTTINGGNLVAGYIPVRSFSGQNKSVTIHGGTLTGLYALYLQSTTTLTIDGGTFNAPTRNAMYIEGASTVNISGDAVFNYDANRQFVGFDSNSVESGSTVSVTGGTFSSDPTAYVASGYVAIGNNNGTWTVGEGNADRNGYQGQEGQTWN